MTQSVRERDEYFLAACRSAFDQLQTYIRNNRFNTEEEQREAVTDAVSHAVGILSITWGLKSSPDLSKVAEALKPFQKLATACNLAKLSDGDLLTRVVLDGEVFSIFAGQLRPPREAYNSLKDERG